MPQPQVVIERPDRSVVGPFNDAQAALRWLGTQGRLPRDARGWIRPLLEPAPPEILGTVLAQGRLS